MKNSTRLLSSILLIALCCFFQFAKAQIVYTDVNPDQICSGNSTYNLDLNNDGTNDFKFTVSFGSTRCGTEGNTHVGSAQVTPLNGSKIVNSGSYPSALLDSAVIDSTVTWSGTSNETLRYVKSGILFCPGSSYGKWHSATDHYLGLKIVINGNTYYGWARLSVDVNAFFSSVTTKDYAYNSVPNQPIFAGQTCPPQSVITASGPTTFCIGDSVILASENSGTNLSYKWKLNGINISGATNKNYTAKVPGKYKVSVTDNTNVCTSTSAVVKVKVPCKVIDENLVAEEDVLKVYPNPISTSCVISFSILQSSNVSLKIFDVDGRLVHTFVNEPMSAGTHELTWDAQNDNGNEVNSGIYFIELKTNLDTRVIRLSVIR